jgi:hypothetical protein
VVLAATLSKEMRQVKPGGRFAHFEVLAMLGAGDKKNNVYRKKDVRERYVRLLVAAIET